MSAKRLYLSPFQVCKFNKWKLIHMEQKWMCLLSPCSVLTELVWPKTKLNFYVHRPILQLVHQPRKKTINVVLAFWQLNKRKIQIYRAKFFFWTMNILRLWELIFSLNTVRLGFRFQTRHNCIRTICLTINVQI